MTTPVPVISVTRRRIKKFALFFFVALTVLIAALSALVSTEYFSRALVNYVARAAHIELGEIHGNLLRGLRISRVDINNNDTRIHAEQLAFQWRPVALFYTTVSLQSLSAERVSIHLPPSTPRDPKTAVTWPSFSQPLRIELEQLQVRNIAIEQAGSTTPIDKVSGSLSVGPLGCQLRDLRVASPIFSTSTSGRVGLRYPYTMDLKTQWQWHFAGDKPLDAQGQLHLIGDIITAKIQHELVQPLQVTSTGSITPALRTTNQSPAVNLISDWKEQAIPAPVLARIDQNEWRDKLRSSKGHLEISGWFNALNITSNVVIDTQDFLLAVDLKGKSEQRGDASGARSVFVIEPLELRVQSHQENAGNNSSLRIAGNVQWRPSWAWNLNVQGKDLNLAPVLSEWPSHLQLAVDTRGHYQSQADAVAVVDFSVSNVQLQGDLRELQVGATGDLAFDGEHWRSTSLQLAIGANQLSLSGDAGKSLGVAWKMNAPLLNQVDPRISGSIVSAGHLGGTLTQPQIMLTADINQLAWRDYAVDKLSFTLKPQQNNESDNYVLALKAQHLQWQSQRISSWVMDGTGSLAQHQIKGKIESPELGAAQFVLSSSWKENQWRGQWHELSLATKNIPRWYLLSSGQMSADANHADLGQLCLTTATESPAQVNSFLTPTELPQSNMAMQLLKKITGQSVQESHVVEQEVPSLCVTSSWDKLAGAKADARLRAMPVRDLDAWFKTDVSLSGFVDGTVNWRADVNKPMLLDAHMQTRDVQFSYQFQGGNTEVYPLQQGSWNASLKDKRLTTIVYLDWGKYGTLNANGIYGLADKKIQGNIKASLVDLAPLESLLPTLNDVRGSAVADINVQGTFDQPDITGDFLLDKGSANVPKLGLSLTDISLHMFSQSTKAIHVDGQITSGDGTLMLKGNLNNVGATNWSWQSNIYGANISIIQNPQVTANVSPNLQLAASAEAIHLTGSSEIPWARAALKTLPESATRVSRDVTVIESKTLVSAKTLEKKSIPFLTNVILYFGDDVYFKGFGLDSQLSGKINVLKEENRQTLTTGFVAVNKGNYKAYGQNLSIERGRLIFQGPYDNPGLDIRALRVTDTITAGLDISGTLQRPKSNVFSIPTTSDSEAMAVLLTGKPLSQSSRSDAYSILGAISSLGMDSGQSMTADIAHFFRLDEITVKSDKGIEQSALWVGKYITPKLFIHYVVGLFDQAFSVGMRYQLNEKFRLEAESGKNQSVDVIYKIER